MQVGKYQLVSKLATGGMAEVFLAKAAGPMGFEKTLVLKRILPHMAEEEAFIEMFLAEARLAAQLNHPNIVQIFDFGEADDTYYLAMEYIDGPNLRVLAKRARSAGVPLPPALCAKIISHACEGLAFAHAFLDPETGEPMGLIHRDISPDNIMVSRQGAVKVVDFGIAKAAGSANKTQTGVVKGKLSYMPPEQLQSKSLDKRVDVYALGVVLYEMLTGQKPFDATTDVSIMQAIMFEDLIPVGQRRPDVPEALQQILERALAKVREQRYPDCHAFQADLERFVMSTGEPVGAYQLSQFIKQFTGEAGAPMPTPAPSGSRRGTGSGVRSSPNAVPPGTGERRAPVGATAADAPRAPLPPREELEPLPDTHVGTPPGVEVKPAREALRPQAPVIDADMRRETVVRAKAPAFEAEPARGPDPKARARVPAADLQQSEGDEDARSIEMEQSPVTEETLTPEDMAAVGRKPRWLVPALVGLVAIAAGGAFVAFRPSPAPAPVAAVAEPVAPPTTPVAEPVKPATPEAPAAVAQKAPEGAPAVVAAAPAVGSQSGVGESEPEAVKARGSAPTEPEAPVENKPAPEAQQAVAVKPAAGTKASTPGRVAAKSGGTGTVEFRIRPYATVIIDGKNIGQTPFAPIQVAPGKHTVRLVNRDLEKEVTRTLDVPAGKTTIFKFNLLEE
jgi:serine/threonine-protein kinase